MVWLSQVCEGDGGSVHSCWSAQAEGVCVVGVGWAGRAACMGGCRGGRCVQAPGCQWPAVCPADVDDCADSPCCQQVCANSPGGYECGCYAGYRLSTDGCSCEGEPLRPWAAGQPGEGRSAWPSRGAHGVSLSCTSPPLGIHGVPAVHRAVRTPPPCPVVAGHSQGLDLQSWLLPESLSQLASLRQVSSVTVPWVRTAGEVAVAVRWSQLREASCSLRPARRGRTGLALRL